MIAIAILLDSGFICAFYNKRDVNHESAVALLQEIESNKFGALYITDYLFDETMTLIFSRIGIEEAITAGKVMLNSYDLIEISKLIFQESWALFQKRKLSFTDCTNVAVMHYYNIGYLATFDSGFKGIVKTLGV